MENLVFGRAKILGYWLIGKRNDVSFLDIIKRFFCLPPFIAANKYISSVEHNEDYDIVTINKKYKIYWPKDESLVEFKNFICEVFQDYKFHKYEKYGTYINSDDVLVDCGASEGFYSLLCSEKCSKVYSIEPDPKRVDAMKKTFEKIANIEIIQAGVSDTCSNEYAFNNSIIYKNDSLDKSKNIKITTLDEEFWTKGIKVTYIKADLEGYELNMLMGAEKLISEYKPKMAITVYHNKDDADKVKNYIEKTFEGYKVVCSGLSEWGTPSMLHAWYEKY